MALRSREGAQELYGVWQCCTGHGDHSGGLTRCEPCSLAARDLMGGMTSHSHNLMTVGMQSAAKSCESTLRGDEL